MRGRLSKTNQRQRTEDRNTYATNTDPVRTDLQHRHTSRHLAVISRETLKSRQAAKRHDGEADRAGDNHDLDYSSAAPSALRFLLGHETMPAMTSTGFTMYMKLKKVT